MNTPSVKSFRALHKLKLKVKRDADVQITKAGGFFKARFCGRANCTFGATVKEAIWRLRSTQSKRWGISPKPITDIEHLLMKGMRWRGTRNGGKKS